MVVNEHTITLGCLVCGQASEPADADFCHPHAQAFGSVRQSYEAWANAFGGIQLADFLKRITKLQGTGRNVREIAEFLQRHPESWK